MLAGAVGLRLIDGLLGGGLDGHRTFRSQYIIRETIDQVDKDLYWSKIDETSFPFY